MADEEENETITALFTILIMVLLGVFFVAQTYVELKQPPFGHETGVVIILGILASYIVLKTTEDHNEATLEKLQFSQETFFFFILPPIIFASGYNMRRKKFFSNLGTIMIFGLVATLVCFSIYTGMTLWVLNKYTFNQSNGTDTKPIKLESFDVMSFCALMCASDVIAAISLISYKQQPKLFSVIYGEGVFNDIVGIIIFDAVFSLKKSGKFDSSTPFEIVGKFFLLAFTSIIIGVVFAVLCSLLLKHVRILTHSAIVETILLYLFASIGYFISEATANSSIISMLVAGILMAHYTFFNLSPQGKTVTSVTFQILGAAAEAYVFTAMGLCIFAYHQYYWSFSFIGVMFGIVIVGRFIAVNFTYRVISLFTKDKSIDCRQLTFIFYGGLIRGAIALGLVLKITADDIEDYQVIQTTTIALVILTTFIFGTFMPVVQKFLIKQPKEEVEEEENADGTKNIIRRGSILTEKKSQIGKGANTEKMKLRISEMSGNHQYTHPQKSQEVNLKKQSQETNFLEVPDKDMKKELISSHHTEFKHPNFMSELSHADAGDGIEELKKKKINKCFKFIKLFDYQVMRPFLIYKYSRQKQMRDFQYAELVIEEGNLIEEILEQPLVDDDDDEDNKRYLRSAIDRPGIGAKTLKDQLIASMTGTRPLERYMSSNNQEELQYKRSEKAMDLNFNDDKGDKSMNGSDTLDK